MQQQISDEAYSRLWDLVVSHFHGGPYSIHGPSHWERVLGNGLRLSQFSGANPDVVRLFALFHDSCRENDGHDPGHGLRGADLAKSLRGHHFDLGDDEFDLLYFACQWHTDQKHHSDATIGTCWDADRFDLTRIGRRPDPSFMSTEAGRKAAAAGSLDLLGDSSSD